MYDFMPYGVLLGLGLAFAGCTRDTVPAQSTQTTAQPQPEVQPPPPAMAATAAPADDLSGKVVETMNSGGYTYAKLERGTQTIWVAGPETTLVVGTQLGAMTGTLMTGFRSNTLDRTFDQIYFVTALPVANGSAPAAVAMTDSPPTSAKPVAMTDSPPTGAKPVEKIEPLAGGKTIAEVFAAKAAGTSVAVRGKVVKVNNGILGRNWLHIQDGSGGAGTNDLTVTTADTVALGDIVVVRGTIATNKNFGSGYKYDVLVENAAVAAK